MFPVMSTGIIGKWSWSSSFKHHIAYFTVLNFIVFPNIAFTIAKTRPASKLTFVTNFKRDLTGLREF
jgi:hypothetical protein